MRIRLYIVGKDVAIMDDNERNYNVNEDIPPEFPEDNGPPVFARDEANTDAPPQFEKKEKSEGIMNSMFGSIKKPKNNASAAKPPITKAPGSNSPKTGLLIGGLVALAVVIGAASLMLFGKTTAESLCKETAEKMRSVESFTSSVNMEMDADVRIEGQDMDFVMDSTYESDVHLDPYISHTEGNYVMTAAGQRETQDVEMYMQKSGKKANLYVLSEGYWLMVENYSISEYDVDLFNSIGKGDLEAKLADDTVTIDGKEAYRLDVVLTGSDLANCFRGETEAVLGMDYSGLNWYSMNADSKLYIYKDSKLPARIDIDASDLGDKFVEAMLDSAFGTDYQYTYNLNKFDVQFTYTDYNDVKPITIPSEVTSGSSTTEDNTDAQPTAEGTYEIKTQNHSAVITPIFEVKNANTYDSYNIYLSDADYNTISYYLHEDTTEDDYVKYFCDDSWREGQSQYTDVVNGEVQSFEVNGMKVNYIINSYTYENMHAKTIYGFTAVDGDILAITLDDSWFNDESDHGINEDMLKKAFENVEVK